MVSRCGGFRVWGLAFKTYIGLKISSGFVVQRSFGIEDLRPMKWLVDEKWRWQFGV